MEFDRLLTELRGHTNEKSRKVEEVASKDKAERRDHHHQTRSLQARSKEERKLIWVYCRNENHRSSECNKIKIINERKSREKEALL